MKQAKEYEIRDFQSENLADLVATDIRDAYSKLWQFSIYVRYKVYNIDPLRANYVVYAQCPKYLLEIFKAHALGYLRAHNDARIARGEW